MNYKNLALKIIGTAFVMALINSNSVLAETVETLSDQPAAVNVATDIYNKTNEPATDSEATISGTCGNNLIWTLTSDGTLTISGTGYMDDYDTEPLPWSNYTKNVKRIIISDGVESIGSYAFSDCDNVSGDLVLPNTVEYISSGAFKECHFSSIDLPDNIDRIEDYAFYGCKSIIKNGLPPSVRRVGNNAFRLCLFNNLSFGQNIEYIGEEAFSLNGNIVADMYFYERSDLRGDLLIPKTVKYIGQNAFYLCGFDGTLTLEEGVECISGGAFTNTFFHGTITIPSTAKCSDLGFMSNVCRIINKSDDNLSLSDCLGDWIDEANPQFIINSLGKGTAIKRCTVEFLSENNLYTTLSVLAGDVIQKPANPCKEGYVFDDWYKAYDEWSNTFSFVWDPNTPVYHSMNLYARFNKCWTVTFMDRNSIIYTQSVKDGDKSIKPKTDLDDNPRFKGWTIKGNNSLYDFNEPVLNDLTLYAMWEEDPTVEPEPSPAPDPTPTKINIQKEKITLSKTSFTYNGNIHVPSIKKIGNYTLKEGTDYSVNIVNGNGDITTSPKSAGTYIVVVTGNGNYAGMTSTKYVINKAKNPIKATGKTATVKYSKLKKKDQTIKRSKIISISKKKGKVTYKKIKGNAKISIDEKTGKITLQKGLKKKTYSVKVKVTATGGKNYKKGSKTVTVKIQIK